DRLAAHPRRLAAARRRARAFRRRGTGDRGRRGHRRRNAHQLPAPAAGDLRCRVRRACGRGVRCRRRRAVPPGRRGGRAHAVAGAAGGLPAAGTRPRPGGAACLAVRRLGRAAGPATPPHRPRRRGGCRWAGPGRRRLRRGLPVHQRPGDGGPAAAGHGSADRRRPHRPALPRHRRGRPGPKSRSRPLVRRHRSAPRPAGRGARRTQRQVLRLM
ncbi:MAG: Urease accessory protein UreF, partial [uncultured Blastococcus sp.]